VSDELATALGLLLRRAQAERLPSVAAALARDGEIVWADAVGLADAERGERATPDHQYRIASITKTFTAVAIMQLRDEGLLDLDDRLSDHLPGAAKGPTIRRMLSHLSGIQREPPGAVWEALAFPTGDDLLTSLAEAEQVQPPHRRFHYSNLCYALLGHLVGALRGARFEEVVEERILGPLGLTRTSFAATGPACVPYVPDPYADVLHREPVMHETGGAAAAGGLWTTAHDLARWGAFLADPDAAVLAPATVEEMCEVQAMHDTERWTLAWGLGLMLLRRGDRILAGHAGAHLGFRASVLAGRAERVAAAVLTNSGTRLDADALAADLVERALELEPVRPEEWQPGEPPSAEVAPVLGRWWTEGEEFVLAWRKGRLEARFADAPPGTEPAVFERLDADRWRTVSGREAGELLEIRRDEGGEPVKLYWATYPCTRRFQTFGQAR
jgi:CubicO group peptidase (beta-lactamase class C family)